MSTKVDVWEESGTQKDDTRKKKDERKICQRYYEEFADATDACGYCHHFGFDHHRHPHGTNCRIRYNTFALKGAEERCKWCGIMSFYHKDVN